MTALRVLVVDDDAAMLQALPEALRLRMGELTVDTADSAAAARFYGDVLGLELTYRAGGGWGPGRPSPSPLPDRPSSTNQTPNPRSPPTPSSSSGSMRAASSSSTEPTRSAEPPFSRRAMLDLEVSPWRSP